MSSYVDIGQIEFESDHEGYISIIFIDYVDSIYNDHDHRPLRYWYVKVNVNVNALF